MRYETSFKNTVLRIADQLKSPGDYPSHFLPSKQPLELNHARDLRLPKLALHDMVQLPPELDRMTAGVPIYLQDAVPGYVFNLETCEEYIRLPRPSCFRSMGHFKNTLCHEMGHWTGLRLGRPKNNYALEEITAEMTAAMLCDVLDIKGDFGHAAYINSFARYNLDMLEQGIIAAVKASEYLLNLADKKESHEA